MKNLLVGTVRASEGFQDAAICDFISAMFVAAISTCNSGSARVLETKSLLLFKASVGPSYRGQNPQNREKRFSDLEKTKKNRFPPPQNNRLESKNPYFPHATCIEEKKEGQTYPKRLSRQFLRTNFARQNTACPKNHLRLFFAFAFARQR